MLLYRLLHVLAETRANFSILRGVYQTALPRVSSSGDGVLVS